MSTASIWKSQLPLSYPSLRENLSCDVGIVGAGIAGLTAAYFLANEGLSVVVLDEKEIGGGETGLTSAHLSNALDDRYSVLERHHGTEGARLAAQSHSTAILTIEKLVQQEKIDCEFARVNGYLFASSSEDASELEKEHAAALRATLPVRWVPRAPWTSFDTGRCLMFPNQAQFHPLKYLYGIAGKMGPRVKIFTSTHVTDIAGGPKAYLKTDTGYTVRAKHVIAATNVPMNDRVVIHTKQAAYRSYVIAVPVEKGNLTPGLYWDTQDPYHYIRLEPSENPAEDYIIIGGEDHKTGQSDDTEVPFQRLETWAREHFPTAKPPAYRWSGQIIEPVDGLAYLGRNPMDEANSYVITGDSGNGLTHGTIGAMIIRDLILGRKNAWAKLYDPSRKPIRAAGEFLKENLNVAPQYFDWLTPGDSQQLAALEPDNGMIVRKGVNKVAVYRDPAGELTACSAVCPHLGCIVDWNNAEKSWDCPCHGSRFDPRGKVLNGPSATDLSTLDSSRLKESV